MFSPSVRVAFSYAGYPGVVGSPKYVTVSILKDPQQFECPYQGTRRETARSPVERKLGFVQDREGMTRIRSRLSRHRRLVGQSKSVPQRHRAPARL